MTTLAITRPTIWRATLLALAVSLLVALVSPTASHAVEVDPPETGDSVLVVTPHPGGDVIMAGGITYALASDVTIAYMTNNDFGIAGGDLGPLQLEAVTAQTANLNRVENDLVFLGYPDGELAGVWGTAAPTAFVASTGLSATYASRGLGSTDWYDHRTGGLDQHADYNQDAMVADMEALIDDRRPAHIFTGGPENRNTDYTTTYNVVSTALDNVVAANPGYGAVLHTTVVWHPDPVLDTKWPQDRAASVDIIADTDPSIVPPATTTLAAAGLVWAEREQFVVPVDLQDENDATNPKAQAIDDFVSQTGLGGFIGRFVHRDEIFWAEYVNYPELSISDATVAEAGSAVFTVSRTGALNVAVSVTATTSDGTAGASDYTATSSSVDLAVGAASATFTVPTISDDIDEADETFTVTLSAPTNSATLAADPTGEGTITDDDTAGVIVDEGDGLSVIEGGALDTYTVVLTSEPTADVVITATPDAQVTAAPSPLTFTAANWDTPQTVSVTGIADAVDEADPHVGTITHAATSSDAGYSGITVASATVDIIDPTGLTVEVTGPKTGSTGLAADYTATATGGNGTVTFAWTVTRGTTAVTTGTGAAFSFTPTLGGMHTVTVIPTDASGSHAPEVVTTNVLTDIAGNTFELDILWLADNGITAGCNPPANDEFCPTKNVTRGQMAAFLVRFLGLTDDGGGNTFTDDDGSVFEDDIAKLAAAGITAGCNPPTNDQYCPGKNVTRGQMAAFLVRALGLTDDGGGNTFTDDDGSVFEDDIAKLAAAGITTGCNADGTQFCPGKSVTRGQMAAFLRRADNL